MSGRFITFEGIDGAGKSTQIAALAGLLAQCGIETVRTREPGGTPAAERVRDVLLGLDMDPFAETLLFFAGRADHVARVIRPALARGAWVLSDRFTDATYAYQVGARGVPASRVEELERLVHGDLQPDVTVLLDLDPVTAARRRAGRSADRFEAEDVRFFERVRNAYLDRARRSPERFLVLDGSMPEAEITERLLREARGWL